MPDTYSITVCVDGESPSELEWQVLLTRLTIAGVTFIRKKSIRLKRKVTRCFLCSQMEDFYRNHSGDAFGSVGALLQDHFYLGHKRKKVGEGHSIHLLCVRMGDHSSR